MASKPRPAPFRPGTWPPSVQDMHVCPKRGLPVPFINEVGPGGVGAFTVLDEQRAAACLRHRLCAMCGKPMRAELALIGDEVSLRPDGWFIEPPVHEQCGLDALGGMCPYLSGERVPRRDHSGDPTIAMVGATPASLAAVGRQIPKRPVIMAITRTYRAGLATSAGSGPVRVYLAGPVRRVRRFAYAADGLLTEVTAAPAPPRPARPQPARIQRVTKRNRKRR